MDSGVVSQLARTDSHLFPCSPVAMEWMIRTADMINDSFRKDYWPGAGSATVPDENVIVVHVIVVPNI